MIALLQSGKAVFGVLAPSARCGIRFMTRWRPRTTSICSRPRRTSGSAGSGRVAGQADRRLPAMRMRRKIARPACRTRGGITGGWRMDDLLPLLLWVFAVVWMLSVCGICIVRSQFERERHPEVNPVSWNVVLAQMVPSAVRGHPLMVYLMASEELSPHSTISTRPLGDRRGDHHRAGFCGAVADGYPGTSHISPKFSAWSAAPRIPRRDACVCQTRIYR